MVNPMKTLMLIVLILLVPQAGADNVDLATLPERRDVQLTIYNSEDLTLVRETRLVSFNGGENVVQFSWANTLIDPSSVELRFVDQADRLEVRDTSYPHDRPQTLYWHIDSTGPTLATVEISYFTSGIGWSADYTGIALPDQSRLDLQGFVRVTNQSGEDYPDAQVRLVVGTINLVDEIAALAQAPATELAEYDESRQKALRYEAARHLFAYRADNAAPTPGELPKQVRKDGLSEYYIFQIDGRESVPDGWSKRLRSVRSEGLPLEVVYRYRVAEYGDRLVRVYRFPNSRAAGLGDAPLPNGRFQVLLRDAAGGLQQLATVEIPYAAPGADVELNLGEDPRVSFELAPERYWRDNIWMRYGRGGVYRQLGSDLLKHEHDASVAGWDQHSVYRQRIRNNSSRAVQVQIRRSYDGDVAFRSELGAVRHDYRTVEYQAVVEPAQRLEQRFEVVRREGRNARQQRVEVQAGQAG